MLEGIPTEVTAVAREIVGALLEGGAPSRQGELAKATITNLDTKKSIECMFRPKEYTFSKTNSWTRGEVRGGNTPQLEFSGGQPTALTMELFFDTYEDGKDVRKAYTNAIWDLMMVNPQTKDPKTHQGRPPLCEFRWGSMWSFKAVITSISQKFTLFLPDGTPVRATLNVSFQQVEEQGLYPRQNPTTGGGYGYKARVVKEGESIDWIAYDEYGDPALWRFLADTNNLENPTRLETGQVLAIAPLP
ncbi:MAG: peptidoglycan-binding protein [Dehalococcoidia bacterium]